MQDKKSVALNGENNRRLKLKTTVAQNVDAAWAEIDKLKPESNVPVPSIESVVNAKEWVDNGSKL